MNKSQWWDWGCHAWPEQQSFSVTHVASWYSGPQRQRLSIQPDSSCSPTNTTGHADSQPSHPCCRSHWCVHRDWGQGVWNSPLSAVATTEPLPCTFILGTQPSAAILNLHLQRLTPRCCLIQLPLPKGSTANNQLLMPSFQHAPFTSQSQFWLCCQEEKCDFFFSLLNLSVIVFNVQLVVFKFHLQFCSLVPSNY